MTEPKCGHNHHSVCNCPCHRNGSKHCVPCCRACPDCRRMVPVWDLRLRQLESTVKGNR